MRFHKISLAAFFAALMLLSSSCGSKKKAVRQYEADGLYPVEVRTDEKKTEKKKKGIRTRIVEEARSWVGTPYRYGGESRKGTDCSGMVMNVYRDVTGIKLPRNSAKQGEYCRRIKRSELLVGDLVFFTSRRGKGINHVGIYVGNGCFVHASTSRGVIVSDLDQDYYTRTYHSAGRVPGLEKGAEEPERENAGKLPAARTPRYERVDRLPGQKKTPEVELPESVIVVDSVAVEADSIREAVRRAF